MVNNIFIPSTAQLPSCIIYFVPSLPTPGKTDTDFEDAFLAFRKGILFLITTFCIIYVFLHALIFYEPVWTPKPTFQTAENNFPDQASILRQLTFFNFHLIYFTLQRWMGKCPCRALPLSLVLSQFDRRFRRFIKGRAPGRLTGCEQELAINLSGCFSLLFLLSFISKTKNTRLKNPTDLLHKSK